MMSEELTVCQKRVIADQAVAKDRLNTLVSVIFDEAELSWNGELSFSGNAIKPLIRAWYPGVYGDTLETLRAAEEAKQRERMERLAQEVKENE